jgi:hypothetical protein
MDGQEFQRDEANGAKQPGASAARLADAIGGPATVYLWTDREGKSAEGRVWSSGGVYRARGGDEVYGGAGWIYAYPSAELAAVFAVLAGDFAEVLWRCDADVKIDWQDRLGCTRVQAVERVTLSAEMLEDDLRIRLAGRVLRHALGLARMDIATIEEQIEAAERALRWASRWRWLLGPTIGWATVAGTKRAGPAFFGGWSAMRGLSTERERQTTEALAEARQRLVLSKRRMAGIKGELYEHLTDFGNMRGISAAQRVAWAAEMAREMSADLELRKHLRAVLSPV